MKIGGISYIPPVPIEVVVKEDIERIIATNENPVDVALELALYVMKTQIFNDGNKRTAIIFANHYLISHGVGLLVVPEGLVPNFKKLLVDYYEGVDLDASRYLCEKMPKNIAFIIYVCEFDRINWSFNMISIFLI